MATPAPTAHTMTKLQDILAILQAITISAEAFPVVGPFAAFAAQLEAIAFAAINAHNAAVGTPLDLSKLHSIDPIA
jgi:hypothetical protein